MGKGEWFGVSIVRTDPFGFKVEEEGGKDKEGEEGGGDEAADDDDGEGFLGLGTDAVGKGHGKQAEHGEQCGHEDGAQPEQRPVDDGGEGRVTLLLKLLKATQHNHPVQDRLAKKRDEAYGSGDTQGDMRQEEG